MIHQGLGVMVDHCDLPRFRPLHDTAPIPRFRRLPPENPT
jgi:hypothetical protein